MSVRSLFLTDQLYEYMLSVSLREDEALAQLRLHSATLDEHHRQIAPEQAQLMAMLVRMLVARRTLDIGTFRGYSALAVALALPDSGKVISCDSDGQWAELAKKYWRLGGVEQKIDFHLKPALQLLDELISAGQEGKFDFAFLDADKINHLTYYERALRLVRPGGVIMLDNLFWAGFVVDPAFQDPDTQAVRLLNATLLKDDRVTLAAIPLGDGIMLATKR